MPERRREALRAYGRNVGFDKLAAADPGRHMCVPRMPATYGCDLDRREFALRQVTVKQNEQKLAWH
jgi:hypothetical protein